MGNITNEGHHNIQFINYYLVNLNGSKLNISGKKHLKAANSSFCSLFSFFMNKAIIYQFPSIFYFKI